MILISISVLYFTLFIYLSKSSVESMVRAAAVSCKKLGESDDEKFKARPI